MFKPKKISEDIDYNDFFDRYLLYDYDDHMIEFKNK
jgi:hypothetical protein